MGAAWRHGDQRPTAAFCRSVGRDRNHTKYYYKTRKTCLKWLRVLRTANNIFKEKEYKRRGRSNNTSRDIQPSSQFTGVMPPTSLYVNKTLGRSNLWDNFLFRFLLTNLLCPNIRITCTTFACYHKGEEKAPSQMVHGDHCSATRTW